MSALDQSSPSNRSKLARLALAYGILGLFRSDEVSALRWLMSAIDAVDGSSTGTLVPTQWVLLRAHDWEERNMKTIRTIGLDIAKSVFQVHAIDAEGNVLIRRQLKRRYVLAFFQKQPPCLVGIEACALSHHWSRELMALGDK